MNVFVPRFSTAWPQASRACSRLIFPVLRTLEAYYVSLHVQ